MSNVAFRTAPTNWWAGRWTLLAQSYNGSGFVCNMYNQLTGELPQISTKKVINFDRWFLSSDKQQQRERERERGDEHCRRIPGSLRSDWLKHLSFLPLDEAVVASRVVFVIVSGSDGRTGRRAETLLQPVK